MRNFEVTRNPLPTGRLAPSPTGAQHLGNARTYLLAWLSMRSQRGRVVLRIEDIDSPRVKPWAVDQAIDDLRWLGLDWDEGPDVGGTHEPYIQTARTHLYNQALHRLIESGCSYPCVCTRTDIESASSAPHESIDGPIYPGTCAGWRYGDRVPLAGTFCWRFRASDSPTTIADRLLGQRTMNVAQQLGDFPLTRKSLDASYQLAVVVDDETMGVTEVVRGNDLLCSAFRQANLQAVLDFSPVIYAHVGLVVGHDGRRLAKRHGDTRLSQYREAGATPETIIGWAAHSAGLINDHQPVRAMDLVDRFCWNEAAAKNVLGSGLFP